MTKRHINHFSNFPPLEPHWSPRWTPKTFAHPFSWKSKKTRADKLSTFIWQFLCKLQCGYKFFQTTWHGHLCIFVIQWNLGKCLPEPLSPVYQCLLLDACCLMIACCWLLDAWTLARPFHKGRRPLVAPPLWNLLWMCLAGVQASSSKQRASSSKHYEIALSKTMGRN